MNSVEFSFENITKGFLHKLFNSIQKLQPTETTKNINSVYAEKNGSFIEMKPRDFQSAESMNLTIFRKSTTKTKRRRRRRCFITSPNDNTQVNDNYKTICEDGKVMSEVISINGTTKKANGLQKAV